MINKLLLCSSAVALAFMVGGFKAYIEDAVENQNVAQIAIEQERAFQAKQDALGVADFSPYI